MAGMVRGWKKETISEKLDRFLLDTGTKKGGACLFQVQLRECFSTWKEVSRLRGRELRANTVLTGFYAREKIRSKFQDFVDYVGEEMEEEASSEELVAAGYNSYMNLARIDYKKLQEQLSGLTAVEKEAADREALIDFFHMLSYKNTFFSDLYGAYTAGLRCGKKGAMRETDRELAALTKKVNASIARYNKAAQGSALEAVLAELELQKQKMTQTIAKAQRLERALAQIMSEENMELLRDKKAETETLKENYRKIGEMVKASLNL